MLIAVVGAQGTGKTTLATALARDIGARLIDEGARICPYPINDNGGDKAQAWILSYQIVQEDEAESKYPVVVSDRAILDQAAYVERLYEMDKVSESFKRFFEGVYAKRMCNYDLLLYVPPEIELVGDDKRPDDKAFQMDIDDRIRSRLNDIQVPWVTVRGTVAERVGTAKTVMSRVVMS